jgi:hypothetical protein
LRVQPCGQTDRVTRAFDDTDHIAIMLAYVQTKTIGTKIYGGKHSPTSFSKQIDCQA